MRTSEQVIEGVENAFKEKLYEFLPYFIIIIVLLIAVPVILRMIKKNMNY